MQKTFLQLPTEREKLFLIPAASHGGSAAALFLPAGKVPCNREVAALPGLDRIDPATASAAVVKFQIDTLSGGSFRQSQTTAVGGDPGELIEEFFIAFTVNASMNLHLTKLAGKNVHHILEGAFKSVARSLKQAVMIDSSLGGEVPSTKGVL